MRHPLTYMYYWNRQIRYYLTIKPLLKPKLTFGQVVEMLQDVAQYVRDNEAGTLKYEINRSLRPGKDGTEDIVMVERRVPQRALSRSHR